MTRRDERKASARKQRRRQRRERAAQMVGEATAQPERGVDAECMRAMAWESLVEDEMLDAQLDTLSAEEFVRAVCRKIGHPPVRLPQSWDEGCRDDARPAEETEAADRESTDDWSAEPARVRHRPASSRSRRSRTAASQPSRTPSHRHCEEAKPTKQSIVPHELLHGLLRYARNDGWGRRVQKPEPRFCFSRIAEVGGACASG